MIAVSHPTGILKGNVKLPSSKSISNRALIIREIAGHDFLINDLAESSDTQILKQLLKTEATELNCGDGGTTFRFLLALKALRGKPCILTGSDRMQQRPVEPLVKALNALGADIHYINKYGYPPLKINLSKLTGNRLTIDSSISSQFISALMMIAPYLPKGLEMLLEGQSVSSSYIQLTKKIMTYFGVRAEVDERKISVPPATYINRDITIEKDWSAASYWFEAVALAKDADVLLEGLSMDSIQGDEVITKLAGLFGVDVKQEENGIRLRKNHDCLFPEYFEYDFTNYPDLAQTMAMLCAAKGVNGRFDGIQTLRIKETDRVGALKIILDRLGFLLTDSENSFAIYKSENIKNTTDPFPVFNDHRMAMSIAPLALTSEKIFIESPEVVSKSYPGFWEELRCMGFEVGPE